MESEAFIEGGPFNRVTRGLFSHLQAAVCRGKFGTHVLAGGGRTAPECQGTTCKTEESSLSLTCLPYQLDHTIEVGQQRAELLALHGEAAGREALPPSPDPNVVGDVVRLRLIQAGKPTFSLPPHETS
jgi:hypothetical protein